MNPSKIQKQIDSILYEYTIANEKWMEEKKKLKESKRKYEEIEKALKIAQAVAESVQRKAHQQLSGLVTTCLKTIFGDEYSFQVRFLQKRNKTEAQLILLKDGHEITDALEQDSGGVLDVAGFGSRLACIMLQKPQPRKVMVLDEPFKFVSVEYKPRVAALLEKLSKDFKTQIILITHEKEYVSGEVIHL